MAGIGNRVNWKGRGDSTRNVNGNFVSDVHANFNVNVSSDVNSNVMLMLILMLILVLMSASVT